MGERIPEPGRRFPNTPTRASRIRGTLSRAAGDSADSAGLPLRARIANTPAHRAGGEPGGRAGRFCTGLWGHAARELFSRLRGGFMPLTIGA